MPEKPAFITKSGQDDLAVMSVETNEQFAGRLELYGLLREGMNDVAAGRTRPLNEAMTDLLDKYRV